jgi:disulfide bond formation protein DsbB
MSGPAALKPIWPYVALAVSGALLAGAHAFERFGGLAPCQLCLEQREAHWIIVVIALTSALVLRFQPKLAWIAATLLGFAFAFSVYKAGFHVGVEQHWLVAQCDAVDVNDITAFDPNGAFEAPKCDEIAWQMFGISMAGWNGIVSLIMAVASFVVAGARRPANA